MKLIGFTPAWRGGWTWKCCWQSGPRAEKKREGCPWLKSHQTVLDARNARVTASPCLLSSRRDRYTWSCVYTCVRSTPSTSERYLSHAFVPLSALFPVHSVPAVTKTRSFVCRWWAYNCGNNVACYGHYGGGMSATCMRLFCLPDWIVISFFYSRACNVILASPRSA